MHTFHSRIPLIPSCSRWHLFSQPLRVSVAKGSWTLTWIHLTYAINTYQTYGWCTEITPFKLFTLLTLILEAALKGNISSLQWAHRKIVNELSTRDHKFYSPSVIISYSSNYWIIIYIYMQSLIFDNSAYIFQFNLFTYSKGKGASELWLCSATWAPCFCSSSSNSGSRSCHWYMVHVNVWKVGGFCIWWSFDSQLMKRNLESSSCFCGFMLLILLTSIQLQDSERPR